MSDRRNIVYLYDGTFEGLLTAVFESFELHLFPCSIESTENGQQSLGAEYIHTHTDATKAERVLNRVLSDSGDRPLFDLYRCFLSNVPDKEMYIFNYIRACMKFKKSVNSRLTVECVNKVVSASQAVGSEAHLYTGFVRFSELENGVYYSRIEPKNNVLPLISTHFRKRYSSMPFIIHDTARNQCLVYNGKTCLIHEGVDIPVLHLSDSESEYRKMWKKFYDTIEIKERHNGRCRMTHMPKRYWKFMTEFL